MKNITLSVDDKILTAARRYAAEHDSSLNALVRDFLTAIANREERAARARRRIKALSRQSKARLGTERKSRDELHER